MRERIADQRYPNLAAEQFLLWLETKCGAIEAKEALDAVRREERMGVVNRALAAIAKRGMAYHGGPRLSSIRDQMVNGTVVDDALHAEIGAE